MIQKSYIVEENIKTLKNKIVLIYGENIGLINDLKEKLKIEIAQNKIIKLLQDDIIKNPNLLINELEARKYPKICIDYYKNKIK